MSILVTNILTWYFSILQNNRHGKSTYYLVLLQSFCSWPLNLGARDIDPPALKNPCVTYRQASIYMVPPFSSSSVLWVPHLHIETTTDHISLYSIYQWNKSIPLLRSLPTPLQSWSMIWSLLLFKLEKEFIYLK